MVYVLVLSEVVYLLVYVVVYVVGVVVVYVVVYKAQNVLGREAAHWQQHHVRFKRHTSTAGRGSGGKKQGEG